LRRCVVKRTVTSANAFPLRWPPGQPRTKNPKWSRFKVTRADAVQDLLAELGRLGARGIVISSNVPLRRDGLMYGDGEPGDPGVAVYFEVDGEEHEIACDCWLRVRDNVHAIALTVEALRGIERWGSTSLMKRVFSAFRMLQSPAQRLWWDVLGVEPNAGADEVREAYRRRALELHPDHGGDDAAMAELNAARDQAERAAGGER
jgi:hypothetical protein